MALAQIPYVLAAPRCGPLVFSGGFILGVNFALPNPAAQNGWIVQELDVFDEYIDAKRENVARSRHEWAAWPIAAGQRAVGDARGKQEVANYLEAQSVKPPKGLAAVESYNNYFSGFFDKGTRGARRVRATAGFYDDAMPPFFGFNKLDPAAGRVFGSRRPPDFWKPVGLARTVQFTWDYRRARSPRHAELKAT